MNDIYAVSIHNGSVSEKNPYVYLIYSHEFDAVYIGQTHSVRGALGRLSEHLADAKSNTFKQKIESIFKYEYVSLNKIEFAAFPLTGREEYKKRAYREAVELRLQNEIINRIGESDIHPAVVSRQQPSSYSDLDFVVKQSSHVARLLFDWLLNVIKQSTSSGSYRKRA